MWDILGLFCPTSNDHGLCPMATRGPPDALPLWPEQHHAPWQSSGPNELISQLEALDAGIGATWGRLGGQRERERQGQQAGVLGIGRWWCGAAEDSSPSK